MMEKSILFSFNWIIIFFISLNFLFDGASIIKYT